MLCYIERFYGSAIVYNPERWGTTDGYIPHRVMLAHWLASVSISAFERLSDIKTHVIIRSREKAESMMHEQLALAFPERTTDG
jgi:hypothetical protein